MIPERAQVILDFWFKHASHKERFGKNETFDTKIKTKFSNDYEKAINNQYDLWQNNHNECLALIIILDQF